LSKARHLTSPTRPAWQRATTHVVAALFSTQKTCEEIINECDFVPKEDYYDGHLIADHLEYIDDMMEKTVKLEEVLDDLKLVHEEARAKVTASNVHWMEPGMIDQLFEQSAAKKEAIRQHIKELKELMEMTKQAFAVDAPDGTSDGYMKEEMEEARHIFDDAAALKVEEDIEKVAGAVKDDVHAKVLQELMRAKKQAFAVHPPDGTSDGYMKEEMDEASHIIDDSPVPKNK